MIFSEAYSDDVLFKGTWVYFIVEDTQIFYSQGYPDILQPRARIPGHIIVDFEHRYQEGNPLMLGPSA